MFRKYNIYHKGQLVCQVTAMTEYSARQKGAEMIAMSASRYSGITSELRVERA